MNFSKNVILWYSENKRDLPWRHTVNPYYIWLSEIILQQTQVKQGLPYYNSFVETFPTVFDLAKSDEQTVLKLWQGLGYYSRARNLHFTAKYIVNELDGKFPDTYNEIIKLKGIGDYTASAIASIAFGESTAVVDGNVYRVLSRFFGIDTPINSTKGIKEFKALATELIDKKQPATFNQAIMEFGARQCKPKNPYCILCPLQSGCVAFQKNKISELPIKLKKLKIRHRYFNFLVIIDRKKNTIIEKRTEKGIWQNLYQFPLIETKDSVGISKFEKKVSKHKLLEDSEFEFSLFNEKDIIHKLSHQHLHTKFWILEVDLIPKKGVSAKKLKDYPVPALISEFIDKFKF
ncbi:A/G-specific adenine glycosylase [Winogradskyella sp. PC-19]|uniref:A/G-specific adenine glycosylase n=1 Tax=unclassified Winogradskyella TaxID=2615021 RepID=UPI000B3BDDB0|nr:MULTISPECIES: A/G-specific adenine glycosylase [unclassified Winogradskyella]ARV09491.1 A/G-specific adenine glycosylase [Winogradskyella sp. PC-19]RZN80296.1 MAG: A/G-specific adenine glycosylase [Winogradskyella sp.]